MLEYGRVEFQTMGGESMHSCWDVGMEEPGTHVGMMLGWRSHALMLG